jgi:transposase-like protein
VYRRSGQDSAGDREWQERPLQGVYAMLVLDAIHYNVRDNGVVVKKAAYVAIGTDLEGRKDVLGIRLGAAESRSTGFRF